MSSGTEGYTTDPLTHTGGSLPFTGSELDVALIATVVLFALSGLLRWLSARTAD